MEENNDFAQMLGLTASVEDLKKAARDLRKKNGNGCVNCNYLGYTTNYQGKHLICDCVKNKMLASIYRKTDVPEIYFHKTIEEWNTKTDGNYNDLGVHSERSEYVYALLRFYFKNISKICQGTNITIKHSKNQKDSLRSLLFMGGNNSGKTFIASIAVQEAIKNNLSAKYYDWSNLVDILSNFSRKEELNEAIETFKEYDFIAIDDIQNYDISQSNFILQLDRLCKSRLHSGKPIFLMASAGYDNTINCSGWKSLLRSCLTIQLPYAIKNLT
jgi:DNA replication protein DnaC